VRLVNILLECLWKIACLKEHSNINLDFYIVLHAKDGFSGGFGDFSTGRLAEDKLGKPAKFSKPTWAILKSSETGVSEQYDHTSGCLFKLFVKYVSCLVLSIEPLANCVNKVLELN